MTGFVAARPSIPKPLPNEIKRKHLLKQMRKAEDARVVALLAPSGYGKTTLLAQYARSSRKKTLWITASPEMRDPVWLGQVLYHMLAPELQLPPVSWEDMHPQALGSLARLMVQGLSDSREHIHILMDQAEHLSEASGKWLTDVIMQLPEGHQFMLAGYDSVPLPWGLWTTRPDIVVLGTQQLAFEPEESQQHLSKLNKSWDGDLHQQSAGWPLGLTLQGTGQTRGLNIQDWIEHRLMELPDDVLHILPALVQHPIWTDPMPLNQGAPLPKGWLKPLLEKGLPLTRLGRGEYQPHTLLMETLDRLLQQHPEEHRRVHLEMAHTAEKQNLWRTAFDHHLKAKHPEGALQCIRKLIPELYQRVEFSTVVTLLRKFPLQDLPRDLQASLAVALLENGQTSESHQMAQDLLTSGFMSSDLCLACGTHAYRQGQKKEYLDWSLQALELSQTPLERLRSHRMRVSALLYNQQHVAALEAGKLYLQEAQSNHQPFSVAKALLMLANVYSDMGSFVEGEQAYLAALKMCQQHHFEASKAEIYYNLSLTLLDDNRPQEALTCLNEALGLPEHLMKHWYPLLIGMRGTILAQLHLFTEAILDFEKAAELCPNYGWGTYTLMYLSAAADAACLAGQQTQARALIEQARLQLAASEDDGLHTLAFSEGLLAWSKNQHCEAEQHLQKADARSLGLWNWALIPLIQADLACKQGSLTRDHLERSFQRLEVLGNDGPLEFLARYLPDLYQSCISQGWYKERMGQALSVGQKPLEMPPHPWILKVQGFGTFVASGSAGPLECALRKSEELLMFLAIHGPCSRDGLIDALWNGENTRKTIDHFKVLVRKLRSELTQALNTPFDPLPFQGQYQLHPSLEVECDVRRFLKTPESTAPALREHILLYQGEFFPRLDTQWADELREQCRELLVHHTLLYARLESDPQEVSQVVQHALNHCPAEEHLYLGLLDVYQQTGNTPAYQSLHQRYQNMLEQEYLNG